MGIRFSRSRARALVVSHEARLTGAPRVAVEILHSLRPADREAALAGRTPA